MLSNYNNLNNKPITRTTLLNLGILLVLGGQVLKTNGNGTFEFVTVSAGGNQNVFTYSRWRYRNYYSKLDNRHFNNLAWSKYDSPAASWRYCYCCLHWFHQTQVKKTHCFQCPNRSGLAQADSKTDTLTIAGGTNITTAVSGDTVTINYSGSNNFGDHSM